MHSVALKLKARFIERESRGHGPVGAMEDSDGSGKSAIDATLGFPIELAVKSLTLRCGDSGTVWR